MDDFDDLDCYDGNPVHDMWVDYTYEQYTGEPVCSETEYIELLLSDKTRICAEGMTQSPI